MQSPSFRYKRRNTAPEYGRASGGQINVLTQSGTNQWHALGWEFLRNNDLDARPFNLTTQSSVPESAAISTALWRRPAEEE